MMRIAAPALFAFAVALLPGAASAQACIGGPLSDGSVAIEGNYAADNLQQSFGGMLTGNPAGPLSVQAGYFARESKGTGRQYGTFSGGIALEIPKLSFSACPYVGARHQVHPAVNGLTKTPVNIAETTIPIGFAVGSSVAAGPSLDVSVFAMPQLLYKRIGITFADGTDGSDSYWQSRWGANLGFRLSSGPVFGGASVFATTSKKHEANPEPELTLSLGLMLGGLTQ